MVTTMAATGEWQPLQTFAVATVAAASLLVTLAADTIFGTNVVTVPAAVAVGVAAALHVVLLWRGVGGGVRAALSVPVALLVLAATTVGVVSPSALGIVVDGWQNGVARLLSSAVPTPQTPDLVVVPVTVAWLMTAAGIETALGRRPVVVVVPLVAGVIAITGLGGDVGLVASAAVVMAVLVALATRRAQSASRGGRRADLIRRLGPGVALALVVGVLAAAVAPTAPGLASRPSWDPRDIDALEPDPTRQLSPLTAAIGALTLDPAVDLFDVSTTVPTRVRLVALDTYDGTAWRASETYVPASRSLPRVGAPDLGLDVVDVTITPTGLRGPFMPVVGHPVRVEEDDFRVAASTGDLIVADGDVSDLSSYALRAELPTAPDLLGTAFRSRERELGDVERWTALPALPADMRALAESIVADATTDYEQLVALQQHFLSEDYRLVDASRFDPTAGLQLPAGHTVGRLRDFLGLRESGGLPRVGSIEQFSASFAVMARILGFPTRLAVGYRQAADGSTVTTERSHAWPEVAMAGHGWTIWDPTPPVDEDIPIPQPPPAEANLPIPLDTPTDVDLPEPLLPELPAPPRSLFRVVLLGGAVLVVLLGAAFARRLVWQRVFERRRWVAAGPNDRVRIAWQDVVARLARVGVPVGVTDTASQVVGALDAERWGPAFAADVARMGDAATRSVGTHAGVDARTSARALEARERVLSALRAIPVRERLQYRRQTHGDRAS